MTVAPNPYSPFATADAALRHIIPIPAFLADVGITPEPGALATTGCGQLAVVPADVAPVTADRLFPANACPACIEAFHADRIDEPSGEITPCRECERPTVHADLCTLCRQENHDTWWAAK